MEDNFLDQMLSFKYQVMPFGLSKHSSQFSGLCQQTHRREARCLCRSYIPVRHPDLYQGSRPAPPRGCTCRFHQDEVRFVGYVVSAECGRIKDKKIEPVKTWSEPRLQQDSGTIHLDALWESSITRSLDNSTSTGLWSRTMRLMEVAVVVVTRSPHHSPRCSGRAQQLDHQRT